MTKATEWSYRVSVTAPDLSDIRRAAERIAGAAIRTPLVRLNADVENAEVYLKLENLQPHGSFKIRAAVSAMRGLPPGALAEGIYTASAGNFALGLAHAARVEGRRITAFAPETAAGAKLTQLHDLGATVRRIPFDEWWRILTTGGHPDQPGNFVHPVASADVMAGNGTIGLEIIEDLPEVDAILVPFGGGGLISGISLAAKALKPAVRIIGCESEAATPLAAAMRAGQPVDSPFDQSSFIDGIGSNRVLASMWPVIRHAVDQAVSVTLAQTEDAVRRLAALNAVVAEGAGAVAPAAALAGQWVPNPGAGKTRLVCVVSGGNIDRAALAAILGRGKDISAAGMPGKAGNRKPG